MTVYHLIPTDEEDLHEADVNCTCEPVFVGPHRLDRMDDDMREATCFEHFPFSPLEQPTDTEWAEYQIKEEVTDG